MSTLARLPQTQRVGFQQVLIATDFSEASRRALTYALAIARRYNSVLSVVHAVPAELRPAIPLEALPQELNSRQIEAERQMRQLGARESFDDLNHHFLLQQGPVWEALSSLIRRGSVDLLVLGTRGRGGLKKLALGSVAEQVLRSAPCPVLTIGPHVASAGATPVEFKRILFASDFGAAANRAFPYALSIAEDHQAKLLLLHMIPPMPLTDVGPVAYGPSAYAAEEFSSWQRRSRDDSRRKLRELLPPTAQLASDPEFIAGTDFLPEGILEVAAKHEIDLIVMGANQTPSARLAAHMPWHLTHEIICRATCPVLTCVG